MNQGHLSELMEHAQTTPDALVHSQLTRPDAIDKTREAAVTSKIICQGCNVEKKTKNSHHRLDEVRHTRVNFFQSFFLVSSFGF